MAVVAVGREGVVWWEGEGKKGWILSSSVCLSPRMESLPKGGGEGFQLPFWPSPAFSLACSYVRLTMRDARRRLTCVHPFSLSSPPPAVPPVLKPGDMHTTYTGCMMMHLVERRWWRCTNTFPLARWCGAVSKG